MRTLALLLVLAGVAGALPPASPGFVRLRELREEIRLGIVELQKREAFEARPREERMLLTFRKGEVFEGEELRGRDVARACLEWADVERQQPTEAGKRVLALLPVVLREKYAGSDDWRERRAIGYLLVRALDSDYLHVREAAIASLRRLYVPPRGDSYDPAQDRRDRASAIRAWKRHVGKRK